MRRPLRPARGYASHAYVRCCWLPHADATKWVVQLPTDIHKENPYFSLRGRTPVVCNWGAHYPKVVGSEGSHIYCESAGQPVAPSMKQRALRPSDSSTPRGHFRPQPQKVCPNRRAHGPGVRAPRSTTHQHQPRNCGHTGRPHSPQPTERPWRFRARTGLRWPPRRCWATDTQSIGKGTCETRLALVTRSLAVRNAHACGEAP